MAKKPTKEQIDKMKARIKSDKTPDSVKNVLKKVLAKIGEDVEDVVEDVEKEEKKVVKKVKKAVKKATKKAPTKSDYEKAKSDLKKKTGKSQEECEEIIEQYKSLRAKAQSQKKKQTATKKQAKKRVDKLKKSDDVIKGTTTKKADKVLEDTAKKVEEKIEKEIEGEVKQEEKEIKKKVEKEVAKDTTKTPTQKKAEVKKKVEAEVEEVKKKATKKVVTEIVIDTKGVIDAISKSLAKFDKDAQKEYLIKLRSDIDKLLAKYMYGGLTDGAVANLNVTNSQMSAESVNPQLYAKGGGVRKFSEGGYNGWTNYATWKVSLEMFDGVDWEDYYQGEPITSDVLESFVDEALDNNETARTYADDFLQDVNYDEIAENINDRYNLEDGEKEEYAKGGRTQEYSKFKVLSIFYSGRKEEKMFDLYSDAEKYYDDLVDDERGGGTTTIILQGYADEFDEFEDIFYFDPMEMSEQDEDFAKGGKTQGYNARQDESLGMRRGKESGYTQSDRARREDSYGKWGKRGAENRGISMATGGKVRTNSKVVREAVRQHILDSVYDENEEEFGNIDDASEYLVSEFKRVADYPYNFNRYPNNQERFEDYLRGIPFHFEWENYKIEDFLNGLGINPQGKEYSTDQMWRLYSYLIWREINDKYNRYKKGGKLWIDTGKKGGTKGVGGRKGTFRAEADKRGIRSKTLAQKVIANPSRYPNISEKSAHMVNNMVAYKKGGRTKDWIQKVTDSPDFRTGAFTKKANERGLTPEQFMSKVLSNPSRYDERTRRQAQFMKNIGD